EARSGARRYAVPRPTRRGPTTRPSDWHSDSTGRDPTPRANTDSRRLARSPSDRSRTWPAANPPPRSVPRSPTTRPPRAWLATGARDPSCRTRIVRHNQQEEGSRELLDALREGARQHALGIVCGDGAHPVPARGERERYR